MSQPQSLDIFALRKWAQRHNLRNRVIPVATFNAAALPPLPIQSLCFASPTGLHAEHPVYLTTCGYCGKGMPCVP